MRIRIQGAKPLRIHADPNPGQTLKSKKVEFLHEKYKYSKVDNRKKHRYEERQKIRSFCKIWSIFMLLDPDPDQHYR
jgi:hypothetical protein